MRTLLTTTLLATGLIVAGLAWQGAADATPPEPVEMPVRFEAVHVYVDSADVPLAAYQFELSATRGTMQILGVENGEHAAFAEPPFYDRKTTQQRATERVVIAAYSTADAAALPTGKTRVATVHLQLSGNNAGDLAVELQAASNPDGDKIQPTITFEKGTQ